MPHARQLIIVIPAEIWVGVENMKRKKKITGKQITRTLTRRERALLEYIRSGKTITDAARQAGFSTKWPGQAGSQAFRNIQRKMPTLLDELGMTLESIVRQVEKDLENEEKEEIEIIEI